MYIRGSPSVTKCHHLQLSSGIMAWMMGFSWALLWVTAHSFDDVSLQTDGSDFPTDEDEYSDLLEMTPERVRRWAEALYGDGDVVGIETRSIALWLKSQHALAAEDAITTMEELDVSQDGLVSEYEYNEALHRLLGRDDREAAEHVNVQRRKFFAADGNVDRALNYTELARFLRPQTDPYMLAAATHIEIEALDVNKDGVLNSEEFLISDMGGDKCTADHRDLYFLQLDENNDGMLNQQEFEGWVSGFSLFLHLLLDAEPHMMNNGIVDPAWLKSIADKGRFSHDITGTDLHHYVSPMMHQLEL